MVSNRQQTSFDARLNFSNRKTAVRELVPALKRSTGLSVPAALTGASPNLRRFGGWFLDSSLGGAGANA